MTSKEFERKCDFYRVFAGAVHLFSDPKVEWCWDIHIYGVDHEHYEKFSLRLPDTTYYGSFGDIDCISIERFTRAQLRTQLCYCKSFFSECSKYQITVLQKDLDLDFLFTLFRPFLTHVQNISSASVAADSQPDPKCDSVPFPAVPECADDLPF